MRLRRRHHRRVPGINTASIADISFTLLILFLVVTSMDDDKGITRMMPPFTPDMLPQTEMLERNVLRVELTAEDRLLVNGDTLQLADLKGRVMEFVDNPGNLPNLPEKHPQQIDLLGECMVTDGHVIQLSTSAETRYETYFQALEEIVKAYRQLRENLAVKKFKKSYSQCTSLQRDALRTYYPQRVSEAYPQEGGKP